MLYARTAQGLQLTDLAANSQMSEPSRARYVVQGIPGPRLPGHGEHRPVLIARGFTAHETCLHQGRDLWAYLQQAVQAWIAGTAAPSLMPQPAAPVPTS